MSYYRGPYNPSTGNPFLHGLMSLSPGIRFLFIANISVYLVQMLLGIFARDLLLDFDVLFGFSVQLAVGRVFLWQFLTYMFLHGDFLHILINLFTLWMFGRRLEARWGTREFLKFYILICGMGAVAVHSILTLVFKQPDMPIIGASGAIYGLLLATAYYWGEQIVLIYFIIPMKMKYALLMIGGLDFLSSVGQIAGTSRSNIAHFAHLGGLLTGWLYLRFGGWFPITKFFRRIFSPPHSPARSSPRSRAIRPVPPPLL